MNVGEHQDRIEDALDAMAADDDVSSEQYIETLSHVSTIAITRARVHLAELTQNREWQRYCLDMDEFLAETDRTPDWHSRAITMHKRTVAWKTTGCPNDQRDRFKNYEDRILHDVFGIEPTEKVTTP